MNWKPLAGAALLAVGRGAAGMARFDNTVAAFLASLAPWVAFPLVAAGFGLAAGEVRGAVALLLVLAVAQLTPAVLSHWFAEKWGRGGQWLRYATAFNWCQWVLPVAFFVVLAVVGGGTPDERSVTITFIGVGLYALWLSWLLARHGLSLGIGRAALLVVAVNAATWLLLETPQFVARVLGAVPGASNGSGS